MVGHIEEKIWMLFLPNLLLLARDRGGREDDPNAGRSEADNDWRRGPPPPPRDDDRLVFNQS